MPSLSYGREPPQIPRQFYARELKQGRKLVWRDTRVIKAVKAIELSWRNSSLVVIFGGPRKHNPLGGIVRAKARIARVGGDYWRNTTCSACRGRDDLIIGQSTSGQLQTPLY